MTTQNSSQVLSATLPVSKQRVKMSKARHREALEGILYTSPWIIGFLLFIAGPLLASLYLSFTKYNVLRPAKFIGFENYIFAFTNDPLFLPSIARTFYFALASVPIAMIGSLIVALLLNQKLVGTTVWRTMYFLPTLTPIVAAALLWRWMLNPDVGLINFLLDKIGIDGPGWLSSTTWAIRPSPCVVRLIRMAPCGASAARILASSMNPPIWSCVDRITGGKPSVGWLRGSSTSISRINC